MVVPDRRSMVEDARTNNRTVASVGQDQDWLTPKASTLSLDSSAAGQSYERETTSGARRSRDGRLLEKAKITQIISSRRLDEGKGLRDHNRASSTLEEEGKRSHCAGGKQLESGRRESSPSAERTHRRTKSRGTKQLERRWSSRYSISTISVLKYLLLKETVERGGLRYC